MCYMSERQCGVATFLIINLLSSLRRTELCLQRGGARSHVHKCNLRTVYPSLPYSNLLRANLWESSPIIFLDINRLLRGNHLSDFKFQYCFIWPWVLEEWFEKCLLGNDYLLVYLCCVIKIVKLHICNMFQPNTFIMFSYNNFMRVV